MLRKRAGSFSTGTLTTWDEEQRSRLGSALRIILGAVLGGCLIISAVCLASGWRVSFWIALSIAAVTSLSLGFARKGRERVGALITLQYLVVAVCYGAFRGNGLHDLSLVTIPIVIMVASLLLEGWTYLAFTVATMLATIVVGLLRWHLGVPEPFNSNPPSELAFLTTLLAVTAIAGRLLSNQLLHHWRLARENEARYRAVYENIQDVYYEMRPDGTLLEMSPAGRSVFQATSDEMIGASLVPFYQLAADHERFMERLRATRRVSNHELTMKDRNGQPHHVLVSASLRGDPGGPEEVVVGSMRDVTDRRALEMHLAQAQKMESLGTLAGGIAHDFNNFLTVINGHCELALSRAKAGDNPADDLSAIGTAGQRAAELTRKLLAFSRKQTFQAKVVDVSGLVSQLGPMIRTLVGEDVRVETRIPPGVPAVPADPGQLEQVLINLLVNARDAINEKTQRASDKRITISARAADFAESTTHVGRRGRCLLLQVGDNGVGMSPEVASRVFDPFFTTKTTGTGLGLATVYGIVAQNGGIVEIESAPDLGTMIRVLWPATDERPPEPRAAIPVPTLGTEGILLVEDDSAVRSFARSALASRGFHVFEAGNGAAALDLLRRHTDRIALMVTDVVMPEMDGEELAQRAREMFPRLPILFTSGYPQDRITKDGVLEEGINFLAKPFSGADLSRGVRDALDAASTGLKRDNQSR